MMREETRAVLVDHLSQLVCDYRLTGGFARFALILALASVLELAPDELTVFA